MGHPPPQPKAVVQEALTYTLMQHHRRTGRGNRNHSRGARKKFKREKGGGGRRKEKRRETRDVDTRRGQGTDARVREVTLRLGDAGQQGGQRPAGARCGAREGIRGDAWFKGCFPPRRHVGRSGPRRQCEWRFLPRGVGRRLEHAPQTDPPPREPPSRSACTPIPAFSVPGGRQLSPLCGPFLLWDHGAPRLPPCAGQVAPAVGSAPSDPSVRAGTASGREERSEARTAVCCI